jgi:hypothetical protein
MAPVRRGGSFNNIIDKDEGMSQNSQRSHQSFIFYLYLAL